MRNGYRLIAVCVFVLLTSGCSAILHTTSPVVSIHEGCSTPFTMQPSFEESADRPFVIQDTTTVAATIIQSDSAARANAIAAIEPSICTSAPQQEMDRRNPPEVPAAAKFDWKFFWVGLAYSILIPFFIPILAFYSYCYSDVKPWKVMLSLFAFLLTLAALTLAIIFIILGNAIWLPLYLSAVAVSLGYTIRLSFLLKM